MRTYPVPAAAVALVGIGAIAWLSGRAGDGRALAFAALAGALFGLFLQRSRFCFLCVTRDFVQRRDARGLLGIVAALIVGVLGYHAVFGAFLPIPAAGRLPPGAHIGPVSWVLAAGGFAFGLGMAISGSCVSAHLYRLGEGSLLAPVALLGVLAGFGLGFASWNPLYLTAIQQAPVTWLPHHLGYGGSLAVSLIALALLAGWLLRRNRAAWFDPDRPAPQGLASLLFGSRWPTYVGGLLIGMLGVVVYLRAFALGVTAELGSLARTGTHALGWLPDRLAGLDGFAGCATLVKEALLSPNGVFVLALVGASLASALASGDFQPRRPQARELGRAALGGLLLGWGAMVALGCTIGTLLSGVMAGALSGWIFGVACLAGVLAGFALRGEWRPGRQGA